MVKKQKNINTEFIANISASFQNAVSETLVKKCNTALLKQNLSQLVVGGGVAANQYIRDAFRRELNGVDLFFPKPERCTDNGAMVAVAGSYRIQGAELETSIKIRPRWSLSEI